jgi:predicted MarR family transcription regulator
MNEEDYQAVRKVLLDTLQQLDDKRNDTIEEVAQAIEEMRCAFGQDTISSFASYIRGMKND